MEVAGGQHTSGYLTSNCPAPGPQSLHVYIKDGYLTFKANCLYTSNFLFMTLESFIQ